MAIVPMPDGPKVSPTVQQADNISLIAPKESQAENAALADYGKATSYLSKAVDNAYERFSKAKADEAFNNIQIATEGILRGQNGALLKQGSECLSGDKPFVDDYMGQIKKVVSDSAQGLDPYQKRILQRRVGNFMENRHAELTRHQIKEAQAFEVTVNKTKAEIAGRNIAIDPANIESFKRNRQDIADAIIAMNPGAPKEALDKAIDDAVSKSLVTGIESFIANGDPGRAQALFAHYKSKGITAFDALSLQPKIRDALIKKQKEAQTQYALMATDQSVSPKGVASSTLTAPDGSEFDEKRFNTAAEQVTNVGRPGWVAPAYLLGEEKTKEILGEWSKQAEELKTKQDEARQKVAENPEDKAAQQAYRDAQAAVAYFEAKDPFEGKLSLAQQTALNDYNNKLQLIDSGDKETIRQQVLFANPGIDEKSLDKVVKTVFERRQRANKVRKLQAAQQASDLFGMLNNGVRFDDIPDSKKDKLTPTQLEGLQMFDSRKATGSKFSTDTNTYCTYRYNNEALASLEWPDLYKFAGIMTPKDLNELIRRKQDIESGKLSKDDPKGVESSVDDVLKRFGYYPKSGSDKELYNGMKRVIVEHVEDKYRDLPPEKWNSMDVQKTVAAFVGQKFSVPGFFWGRNEKTIGDLLQSKSAVRDDNGLNNMIDEALKSTGYPDPKQVDRAAYVLDFLLNERKPLPGEEALINAIPATELMKIKKAYPGADNHAIVRAALTARLLKEDK